jgi:DNA mismatch endonuclease (patch repair protein)
MDRVSPVVRSKIMRSVRTANTGPEVLIRKAMHKRGYRYSLHRRDLPGRPDIVFPIRRKAIFVNGCFWHGHRCKKGRLPKSRIDYWSQKVSDNRSRDRKVRKALIGLGWKSLTIWQCQTQDIEKTVDKIVRFLESA